jgi:hypothetical protein
LLGEDLTTFSCKIPHVSKKKKKKKKIRKGGPKLGCGCVEQKEVLLTGTDLINATVFVVLFVAFCDINVILHCLAISRKELGQLSDCVLISVCLHNPVRSKYRYLGSGLPVFILFYENIHLRQSSDTNVYAQTDILLCV